MRDLNNLHRWELANRDKILAQRRARYILNHDRELQREKKWKKENRERYLEFRRSYYKKHRDKFRKASRIYRSRNKAKLKRSQSKWKKANPSWHNNYNNQKYAEDIHFRLSRTFRNRIRFMLRRSLANKQCKSLDFLGCSIIDLKIYLESRFEPGMRWDNYGRGGWEIDHIMPCAIFDLSKPEHQKRCFHFSNLQPMWATENRKKQAKVLSNQFTLL